MRRSCWSRTYCAPPRPRGPGRRTSADGPVGPGSSAGSGRAAPVPTLLSPSFPSFSRRMESRFLIRFKDRPTLTEYDGFAQLVGPRAPMSIASDRIHYYPRQDLGRGVSERPVFVWSGSTCSKPRTACAGIDPAQLVQGLTIGSKYRSPYASIEDEPLPRRSRRRPSARGAQERHTRAPARPDQQPRPRSSPKRRRRHRVRIRSTGRLVGRSQTLVNRLRTHDADDRFLATGTTTINGQPRSVRAVAWQPFPAWTRRRISPRRSMSFARRKKHSACTSSSSIATPTAGPITMVQESPTPTAAFGLLHQLRSTCRTPPFDLTVFGLRGRRGLPRPHRRRRAPRAGLLPAQLSPQSRADRRRLVRDDHADQGNRPGPEGPPLAQNSASAIAGAAPRARAAAGPITAVAR